MQLGMSATGQQETSFDHLVGALLHEKRHLQPKRLGRLKVDNQFVLGRRLNRQLARLLALEDAINVARRAPEVGDKRPPARANERNG
jgi:hypothetical protein